jgi:preprotein translocase subunit SecA
VNLLNAANDADEARGITLAGIGGQITISTQIAGRGTDIVCDDAALAHGGLHVLNLQHNRSRRIDRQMIGRAARQGDPGSAEHWIRLRGGPLEPERLPPGLRLPCQLLARLGLAGALLRYAQTVWGLEDRLQRKGRLSSDRKWSRQLHFSNMRSQ